MGAILVGFDGIYDKDERAALIKKELARLRKLLSDTDPGKLKILDRLIHDAAFMAVTLEETRLIIARDGIIETYQNGENQSGIKKSAAVEVYDKMVNTYAKVIGQICDVLDVKAQKVGDAGGGLMQFAVAGKR